MAPLSGWSTTSTGSARRDIESIALLVPPSVHSSMLQE